MESDSSVVGVTVEGEASLVDDDVMMKPTQPNQISGVGLSALGPGDDVVGLDSVTATTPVGGTHPVVTVNHRPT